MNHFLYSPVFYQGAAVNHGERLVMVFDAL
jgi:hypothetical protein